MEGEREEAGAARLIVTKMGRNWTVKVKLVHGRGGGGGGGGVRKLAWHFWGGTLCYRGESSHD